MQCLRKQKLGRTELGATCKAYYLLTAIHSMKQKPVHYYRKVIKERDPTLMNREVVVDEEETRNLVAGQALVVRYISEQKL